VLFEASDQRSLVASDSEALFQQASLNGTTESLELRKIGSENGAMGL